MFYREFQTQRCWLVCILTLCMVESSVAQEAAPDGGIRLTESRTQKMKVGIRIRAKVLCRGITASVPMPMDWPEQQVQVIGEEV